MKFVCVISIVAICICVVGAAKSKSQSSSVLSDILDDLDLHSDNRVRPGYGEKPLEIQAFVFIRNIIEINEEKSTMTVNLLLMQMWNDPRLSFEGGGSKEGSVSEILIDNPDFMSTFWNPDTFIINEVASNSRFASSDAGSEKNLANQIVRLSRNGDVLKTSRLTVAVTCPMRFESYPMHSFDCDIDMESFGHKTDDILYLWRNGSKSVDLTKVDKASLAGKSSYSLEYVETHSQQSYLDTGGSYSRLIIRFHLKKLWMRHAICFFFPTAFLTVCSLISLWVIGKDYAGAGIISNFIIAGLLILLMSLVYSTTPILSRVPFLCPVDFHLGICLSTVFSSIAFHGVCFCCRNSRCFEDGGRRVERKSKLRRRHVSESTVAVEVDKILKTRYADSSKTAVGLTKHDEEVSYYESYDETGADEVFGSDDQEEGETVGGVDEHEQQKQQCGGNNDLTVEGASGHKASGIQEKMRSRKKSTFVTWLVTASLTLSKWISLFCFVSTECLLWYTFGIDRNNGVVGAAVVVS